MLTPFRAWHAAVGAPLRCAQLVRVNHVSVSHRSLTVVHCTSDYKADDHQLRSKEALISSREDKLWSRMEQLLDREAQLREDEREAARRRELHLQSQLDKLLSVSSQQQTERSLPPSASPSQLLQSAQSGSSTPQARDLESEQTGAAFQSHGTFDTADESSLSSDVKAGLDSIGVGSSQASSPGQPAAAIEVQDVIDAVLSGQVNPLIKDYFSRDATPAGASSETVSDATSPPAPATPTAASPAMQPTASADESSLSSDVKAGLDSIGVGSSQASSPGQSAAAIEVQNVIDAVLSGQVDPLIDDFSRYATPAGASSETVSDATAPPAPATPTAASPAMQPTASALGGAVPPHVEAALDESRDALQASGKTAGAPLENQKAAPSGPPPVLILGDDDIYWVGQLHAALLKEGCYCGEMDEDDFFFGSFTQNSILAFQAIKNMPETGIVDDDTWKALGVTGGSSAEDGYVWQRGDIAAAPTSNGTTNGTGNGSSSSAPSPAEEGYVWQQGGSTSTTSSSEFGNVAPFGGLFSDLGMSFSTTYSSTTTSGSSSRRGASSQGKGSEESGGNSPQGGLYKGERQQGQEPQYSKWPVLREGDGERGVHTVHVRCYLVLLRKHGYYCDEDDTKWWMFGGPTLASLQTFQACSGLPESGVCDEKTWRSLLGPDASPQEIDLWWSGDGDDEDMEQIGQGAVYLLGEQRWCIQTKSTGTFH